MPKQVPVTVLSGFLGSGKTTLLHSLVTQSAKQDPPGRVAIIVNDMSSLDVDGVVAEGTEVVSPSLGNFAALNDGSIHEAELLERLREETDRILEGYRPDHLIIETSGSTRPWPLIRFLRTHPKLELRGFLSLIDSAMLRDDFALGHAIVPRLQQHLQQGTRGIENLMAEQLMFANWILLTKLDKISDEDVQEIAKAISPINPFAAISGTSYGNIRYADVMKAPPYDARRVAQLGRELDDADAQAGREDGIASLVIDTPRGFHPERLHTAFTEQLPQVLYRSKGFFWLPARDDLVLLWNQAAGGVGLEALGYWKAGILTHDGSRLNDDERRVLEATLARLDPLVGDRRTQITLIGERDDTVAFEQVLRECLLSDEELVEWAEGHDFADPWPRSTVTLGTPD